MVCKKTRYFNFRNIASSEIAFDDGINIICGDNAEGKTSAIEGIYLCAQGRSHRTSHEKEFIKFGENEGGVSIVYEDRFRENELGIEWSQKGRRKCVKNDYPIKKLSEFIGNFKAVIFTPEHLSIVKDGPSMRRSFLDNAISQIDREYVASLQKYSKVLLQRNKLISEAGQDPSALKTVDVWSEQLAFEAEIISKKREEYVREAERLLETVFLDMTGGKEKPSLEYTGAKSKEDYFKLLTENLSKEVRYGATLYGIHKDDITIMLNKKEARSFASQGQQRSLSLALKLAEGEISKRESGEYPVFLFDDVLSELDSKRKEYLMGGIENRQVIITTCEKDGIIKDKGKVIFAKGGDYFE